MTTEIFYDWFQFFILSIPLPRPVLLIMNGHASHVTINPLPTIIEIIINPNLIKKFCMAGALNIYIAFQHYNSRIL